MDHHYELMATIKTGGFGSVCYAKHTITGQIRAVKVLKSFVSTKAALDEAKLLAMLNEADTDGFIVKFHGAYEDNGSHHLVFDMMKCDLKQWVQFMYPNGVPLEPLKVLSVKMMGAFQFLASHNIVHADIKPNNFLMACSCPSSLRVCDFGNARVRAFPPTAMVFPSLLGVASYRSPEVILGYPSRHLRSIDMWAVGCLLLELLLKKPFFKPSRSNVRKEAGGRKVLLQQCNALCKPPPHMLEGSRDTWFCSHLKTDKRYPEYRSSEPPLLYMLFEKLHTQRGNGRQEVVSLCDFIWRFLTMDPDDRMTPTVALAHAFLNGINEL